MGDDTPSPPVVAFQGGEGAYSAIAARAYFARAGMPAALRGFPRFADALGAAERHEAAWAFLPIENTTAGSINETYDLLRHTELRIVGEEILEVRHCLLGLAGATLGTIRTVLSHPQALAQCGRFLATLPHATAGAFVDTAEAARHVRESGDPSLAALASEEAGRLHGLEVLARDVADQQENWTRFVVVGARPPADVAPGPRKTSLVLSTAHRPGALARCLEVLAAERLNLTKVESRPMPRRPWEYLFYLDFEESTDEEAAARAIETLRRECPLLKVLGSYAARTIG